MSFIKHEHEPRGNAIRHEVATYIGLGQNTYTPTQVAVAKAKGCHLWTVDGRKLVDFTSGVLVQNLGYRHPKFEKYWASYRNGLPVNAYNMVSHVFAKASKCLIKSMKTNPNAQKILWAASGSEGIQKAMWTALHRYPDRNIMVATRYGFHGKKGLAADVTGETSKNPDVRFISFPMEEEKEPEFYQEELDALHKAYPGKIALLITEPYLGAKGSFHPPVWYHQILQHWCNKHDIPFIFDEVQSCFGRTGNMYAYESYQVTPDLVVLGKGLANGEPAAAVVGRADLIDSLQYGEASDTYSASVPACAAVCAALDVFKEDRIVNSARKNALKLGKRLTDLAAEFSFIRDVRGEGMVYGVEIEDAITANRCVLEAYRATTRKGIHFLGPLAEKVLRVSPPLVITEEELEEAFSLLHKAWRRITGK
ncbi:MAG: 4-aminobutyrate aminotransferase GabT [Candidatus Hydrogenedentes bacterium ADurb.Bin101]|jgi:4-aminobutyrate aminotransferase-like enzyme|nr:MAG: 4-aminobutyrate aminotransferase GabT [Candidatus Hydrogenedentes bacterium ADurb.Bin101]HOC68145.1 aminotransferase class III-fold pyridoxal phosphate-dependent enzyme [Candidatus Hydrogenedentota bacterium]